MAPSAHMSTVRIARPGRPGRGSGGPGAGEIGVQQDGAGVDRGPQRDRCELRGAEVGGEEGDAEGVPEEAHAEGGEDVPRQVPAPAERSVDVLHEPVRERAPPRPPQLGGVLAGEEPAEVGAELDAEEERRALDHRPAAQRAERRPDEEDGRAGPRQGRSPDSRVPCRPRPGCGVRPTPAARPRRCGGRRGHGRA